MRKIFTLGHIKSGKLHIHKRKQLDEAIKLMPDCRIKLEISKIYNRRSDKQNRYYWGVIVEIWRELILTEWGESYSAEQVHEFLKLNLNSTEIVNESTGEVLRKPKSTTVLSTVEMEEYHEKCRQVAFEMFNVIIPLPEEQTEMEF